MSCSVGRPVLTRFRDQSLVLSLILPLSIAAIAAAAVAAAAYCSRKDTVKALHLERRKQSTGIRAQLSVSLAINSKSTLSYALTAETDDDIA